jgi:hypothetical protein
VIFQNGDYRARWECAAHGETRLADAVAVNTLEGEQVAAWFPLSPALRTVHTATLGEANPLSQNTQFRLRISVAGRKSLLGTATDITRSVPFRTGARNAKIFFTRIQVHRDGDPGLKGAGEFRFRFYASDASDSILEFPSPPELARDVDDGGPREGIAVNREITAPLAPRQLRIGVLAIEDDSHFPPLPGWGIDVIGMPSGIDGSGFRSQDYTEQAWVAQTFDLTTVPVGSNADAIRFVMPTGDFGIAFTVHGRIEVNSRGGVGKFTHPLDTTPQPLAAVLVTPGTVKVFTPVGRKAKALALGPEGGIWGSSAVPARGVVVAGAAAGRPGYGGGAPGQRGRGARPGCRGCCAALVGRR